MLTFGSRGALHGHPARALCSPQLDQEGQCAQLGPRGQVWGWGLGDQYSWLHHSLSSLLCGRSASSGSHCPLPHVKAQGPTWRKSFNYYPASPHRLKNCFTLLFMETQQKRHWAGGQGTWVPALGVALGPSSPPCPRVPATLPPNTHSSSGLFLLPGTSSPLLFSPAILSSLCCWHQRPCPTTLTQIPT